MYSKSIELLNKALADELTAVHQYLYFHFRCEDMGLEPLANLFRRISIVEMEHVEKLAERILFLKGEVEMKPSQSVQKIHMPEQMLQLARQLEEETVKNYNMWAKECGENADSVSKNLFESLTKEEEDHFDLFDQELENLKVYGPQYLALQSIERIKREHQ